MATTVREMEIGIDADLQTLLTQVTLRPRGTLLACQPFGDAVNFSVRE